MRRQLQTGDLIGDRRVNWAETPRSVVVALEGVLSCDNRQHGQRGGLPRHQDRRCVNVVVKTRQVSIPHCGVVKRIVDKVITVARGGQPAVLPSYTSGSLMLRAGHRPVRLPKQFGRAVSKHVGPGREDCEHKRRRKTVSSYGRTTSNTPPPIHDPPAASATNDAAPASCYPMTVAEIVNEPASIAAPRSWRVGVRGHGEAI